MKTLLRIDASVRSTDSISRRTGDYFETGWLENYPGTRVLRRDLAERPPPHLSEEVMAAFFQENQKSSSLQDSNELVGELTTSETILICTPIYNFHLPSNLKAWIDHIVRPGLTFTRDAEGNHEGLLRDRSVFVVVARGGRMSDAATDPVVSYLTELFRYIGMDETKVFTIDGTADPSYAAESEQATRARIDQFLHTT